MKSLGNDKSRKEKVLKPKNDNNYLRVQLWKNGKGKMFLVHRLLATAFIPNPYGFKQVNHKDEIKANNFVFINEGGFVDLEKSNIEWCSAKYNTNYGTRTERSAATQSKPVEASKYPDFREICLRFGSVKETKMKGYNPSNVSACCRGCFNREGNNKYKKLYWRFAV